MPNGGSFDAAISLLYETVLDAGKWPAAVAELAALFDAKKAFLFDYDFAAATASPLVVHGYDVETLRLWGEYYHQIDPGRIPGGAGKIGEWLADEVMLDLNAKSQQEYVRDFALPRGFGRLAGWKISGDAERFRFVSFARPPGAERFGGAGQQLHAAVQPHLLRIARMESRIEALTEGQALARAAIDRLQVAVVVVDRRLGVRLVNAYGIRLLSNRRDLHISMGRLACGQPKYDELLRRAVAVACGKDPRGAPMRIPQSSQTAGLLLMVVPLNPQHELAASSHEEPLALVVVADPAAESVAAEVYRQLFQLTPAEAALLVGLVRGETLSEWACARGVSKTTVRSQLRALMQKVGVNSQARLVGLAKSLPPLT